MKLYRFSPIGTKEQLLAAIKHIHLLSYKLCEDSLGYYLPNAGNLGIFCHYDEEYLALVEVRKELTEPSDNPNQKYFKLHEPITIPAQDDTPEATYTHLYIRKPDIYRAQAGDIDFYVEQVEYDKLKQQILSGATIPGARMFPRNDLDMIELYNPDLDVLAYVSPRDMTEKVRIKLSNETNF